MIGKSNWECGIGLREKRSRSAKGVRSGEVLVNLRVVRCADRGMELAGRQGFVPIHNEAKPSCDVPESASQLLNEAEGRMSVAGRQGFELGVTRFSKQVMARDFWF